MAALTIPPNEKPAAATDHGGLILVLSTALPLTPGKDRSNDLVHAPGARV